VGELAEPFGLTQVGSSAMPFKRNPIQAEKVDSLARQLAQLPRLAWDNAAHSLLERTLDDSANRRTLLPEAFLIADELVGVTTRIVKGLQVNESALARNFAAYAPFAATERLLMVLGKAGADRQEMHERLRKHTMAAWESIQEGQPNPLAEELAVDPELQAFLSPEDIRSLMDARRYLGDAAQRAHRFAADLNQVLESFPE
jgi:adenylosuccinate lyase